MKRDENIEPVGRVVNIREILIKGGAVFTMDTNRSVKLITLTDQLQQSMTHGQNKIAHLFVF